MLLICWLLNFAVLLAVELCRVVDIAFVFTKNVLQRGSTVSQQPPVIGSHTTQKSTALAFLRQTVSGTMNNDEWF